MKKLLSVLMLCGFLLSSVSFVVLAEENSRMKYAAGDRLKMMNSRERFSLEQENEDDSSESESDDDSRMMEGNAKGMMTSQKEDHLKLAQTRRLALEDSAKVLREECRAKDTLEGNCGKSFDKIKEHLTSVVDRMIEAFTALKTKVTSSDLQDKDAVLGRIDQTLTSVEGFKTQIAYAETREQLKEVMTQIRKAWIDYKQFFHDKRDELYKSRVSSVLTKANQVQTRMQQVLENLKKNSDANAEQILNLQRALTSLEQQITLVKTTATSEGKDALKEALQKLHDSLKTVTNQFKNTGRMMKPAATRTAAVPVEVEP